MPDVYLGLGSNIGQPAGNLREAVHRLGEILDVGRISCVYRTEPVGVRDQPYFLNAALSGRTELSARALLHALLGLEEAMGRTRHTPMGPRSIDVDLLLYGDEVLDERGLTVPHPRMTERRFVLEPLAEIAPEACVPGTGRTVSELLAMLPDAESVERIDVPDWPPRGRPM